MPEEIDYTKISSHDLIQKRLIEYAFSTCIRATNKEEPVADFTHQTGFVRAVILLKSMLWKYTPGDIKKEIKNLYDELAKNFKEIDNSTLSEPNKRSNKQKLEDENAMSILELLIVVLQYSPSNVEMKTMNITSNTIPTIATTIRTEEKIRLFPDSNVNIEKESEDIE